MWDLDGKDRSRPLSEMIDMQAYRKTMDRRQRQSQRARERRESRSIILCAAGLLVAMSYLVFAMAPDSFWTHLAAAIH